MSPNPLFLHILPVIAILAIARSPKATLRKMSQPDTASLWPRVAGCDASSPGLRHLPS